MRATVLLPRDRRTGSLRVRGSPLQMLDAGRVSRAAEREVHQRERILPPISTFRWWARRTSAVTGGVLDAYSAQRPGGAACL